MKTEHEAFQFLLAGIPSRKMPFFFPSTTKRQSCAIVPKWPLRTQSTGFLIGLDFHNLDNATCHMIEVCLDCHILDSQDHRVDHEVFTYSILFVGYFAISFGARCSSGYVCLQNECCPLVAYDYLDLYGTNAQNTFKRTHK
jgi:hypothetical protein